MSSNKDTSSFIGPTAIAKYCGVHRKTAYQWISEGKLNAISTPGGHARVRKSDFVTFLRHHKMEVPAELLAYLPPQRVMVVDDDPAMLEMCAAFFKKLRPHIEVKTMTSGIDACLDIGFFKPQVLILDVIMPEINGIEVIERIKRNQLLKDVSIICITGQSDCEESARMQTQPIDRLFKKPINFGDLVEVVDELMDKALSTV